MVRRTCFKFCVHTFVTTGLFSRPHRHAVIGILGFGLWLLAPGRASAVIGETVEDLYKRYRAGKEVGAQMLYQAGDYSLTVYFKDKKASMDVYCRLPAVDGTHQELTDEDIQKLLKIEGESQTWNSVVSKTGEQTWVRADGKILARCKKKEKALVFLDASVK